MFLAVPDDNSIYLSSFLGFALTLVGGYLLALLSSRHKKIATQETETVNAEKGWRESLRVAIEINKEAIAANKSAIASDKTERLLWQLKREAEAAMVVGILEENTEAQKILASIVSTTRHLEGGQARTEHDIRELRNHISAIQTQLLALAQSRNACT